MHVDFINPEYRGKCDCPQHRKLPWSRWIDANSGQPVVVGQTYMGHKILKLEDWFFLARAYVENEQGRRFWQPCLVRFSHPVYPGKRTIFLPT